MDNKYDLKAGGLPSSQKEEKDYKVAEFSTQEFKVERLAEPVYLYQKGISSISTGSTAESFRPMNQKYKGCLPTRKKEQEILSKKKQRLPYVLEDSSRKKTAYVGNKTGADQDRYVMFLMSATDTMHMYPIKDWYSFAPKITRKVYSFEEAEAEFSRRRGDDSDDDGDYGDDSGEEDEGDEIDFNEKMSDDEDVHGIGNSDDNEDVANMIKGMEDTKSDIEDDEEDENTPVGVEDPNKDPDEETPAPVDAPEQAVGATHDPLHPPESEGGSGDKEGEDSKKRAADSPAGGAEEPARKKARTDGGPEDDDPDGKKWDRKMEEHVKKLLLKRGNMTAQRLLKYFKKRHGLDDKKKKARFFKIVSKLAMIEEKPDGGKVVSLKQIYVPSL